MVVLSRKDPQAGSAAALMEKRMVREPKV